MRTMRLFGVSALLAIATLTTSAFAEEGFDLALSKGHVEVTPKPGWHVNLEFGWGMNKVVIQDGKHVKGEKVISKDQMKLDKAKASVDAPPGQYFLHGAVCSETNCAPFNKEITVP